MDNTMLQRYSERIRNIDMWYNVTRFRFKKMKIFGHEIRVPRKYAKEFEEKITILEVTMELAEIKHTIRSNHTMLEVSFFSNLNKNMIELVLDFEFYSGFTVTENKNFKKNSRLRRVSIRRPWSSEAKYNFRIKSSTFNNADYHELISKSNEFHLVVDKMIRCLQNMYK